MTFIEEIIQKAAESSPLSGTLLENAEFILNDNSSVLTVQLKKQGSFLLHVNKTNAIIEDIVKERFGQGIKVVLNDPAAETVTLEPPLSVFFKPEKPKVQPKSQIKEEKPFEPRNTRNTRKSQKISAKELKGVITDLDEPLTEGDDILLEGVIFRLEKTVTRTGRLMCVMDIFDGTDSITVKFFLKDMK